MRTFLKSKPSFIQIHIFKNNYVTVKYIYLDKLKLRKYIFLPLACVLFTFIIYYFTPDKYTSTKFFLYQTNIYMHNF